MSKLNLKKREWTFIIVGVLVVSLAVVIPVVRRAKSAYEKSTAQVRQAENRLHDARDLRLLIEAERSGRKAIRERLAQRPGNFSLYSFANRCLLELDLKQRAKLNTENARGSHLESAKLRLEGVSMEELVNFLHRLYDNNNLIVVQKLDHLRPARDGQGLDCYMTLMAPRA